MQHNTNTNIVAADNGKGFVEIRDLSDIRKLIQLTVDKQRQRAFVFAVGDAHERFKQLTVKDVDNRLIWIPCGRDNQENRCFLLADALKIHFIG